MFLRTLVFATMAVSAVSANAVPLTFSQLSGSAGGSPASTGVYKASLSALGLASILSISIRDNSGLLGGSPGQFSGFDLDAIKLSTTDCSDAACASAAVGLSVFDFSGGATFTPGSQRAPTDPKLFGTDSLGTSIDPAVATLSAFDANSTTAIPGADGFVSMGDNGLIDFNLTSAALTAGLFLYIGEVGDNGEVAASNITVRDRRTVPEPGTLGLIGLALSSLAFWRRRSITRLA
jgi:hypothetical protein